MPYSKGYQSADKDHQAAYASDQTARESREECAQKTSPQEAIECYDEKVTADREHQRSEQDLDAQREMANWAEGMLWATAVVGCLTVGVAGLGAYWIRETLSATKDAVKAADAAVLVTRDIGEKQVRAYVSVDKIRISETPDDIGRFRAEVTLKNNGQSPALEVDNELQVAFISTSPPKKLSANQLELPPVVAQPGSSKNPIAAGGFVNNHAHTSPVPYDAMHLGLVDSGAAVLIARGWVEYTDVFGKRHRTDYAWHRDRDAINAGFNVVASAKGNHVS